jgi:hypothetical protein
MGNGSEAIATLAPQDISLEELTTRSDLADPRTYVHYRPSLSGERIPTQVRRVPPLRVPNSQKTPRCDSSTGEQKRVSFLSIYQVG